MPDTRALLAQWHDAQLHIDALDAGLAVPGLTPRDRTRLADERAGWRIAQAGIETELATGTD